MIIDFCVSFCMVSIDSFGILFIISIVGKGGGGCLLLLLVVFVVVFSFKRQVCF